MKKMTMGLSVGAAMWLAMLGTAAAQDGDAPPDAIVAGMGGTGFGGSGGVAQPMVADVRLVNAGAGIPVGGALLIYSGGSIGGTAPIVEIENAETPGTTLGGTLSMFLGSIYWIWVPNAPFIEGATYQVRLSATDLGIVGNTDTFEVVPAITIARPAISTAPSASWRGEAVQSACCRTLVGTSLVENGGCFPSIQRASIMLDPGFTTSEPALVINQFVFRMGFGGTPANLGQPSLWPNFFAAPIYEQAEEYCFAIEAIDIVSGMVFTYEDLATCAPHGALGDLGEVPLEPGIAELDRLVCHAPPAQFEEEWCELNEEPCADDAMATACGLYGHVCRDEPLPPDPFSMTGGFAGMVAMGGFGGFGGMAGAGGSGGAGSVGATGGASGMNDGGDSGASGDGGDGDDSGGSSHGSGCSAVMSRHTERGAPAYALWLSAAALVVAARRKRAR